MQQDTSKIKSLEEARREFSTVYKCEQHLRRLRWPNGVECPRCGAKHPGYIKTRKTWQCKECRYQFSVTTRTIFHRSKIDLPVWFQAIWLMCHSPKGISSKQIEREFGVHYETAWYMTKRVRRAMKHDIFEDKLCGIVEVDSGVVKADGGAATGNVKYQAKDVLGIVERGGGLRMVVLDRLTQANVERVFRENVGMVQMIYTDMCQKLNPVEKFGPRRKVNHMLGQILNRWVDGDAHVNYVENAWSLFKRGLTGMYHHVSAKYLQEYLDEFAFRYSHRGEKGRLFDLVLASC